MENRRHARDAAPLLRVRHFRRRHSLRNQELKGRRAAHSRAEPQAAANKSSSPRQALESLESLESLGHYSEVIVRFTLTPRVEQAGIVFLSHSLRTLPFFPTLLKNARQRKIDSRGLRLSSLNSVRQLQVLCISIKPSLHANDWVKCFVRDLPLCGRSTIALPQNRQVIFLQGGV